MENKMYFDFKLAAIPFLHLLKFKTLCTLCTNTNKLDIVFNFQTINRSVKPCVKIALPNLPSSKTAKCSRSDILVTTTKHPNSPRATLANCLMTKLWQTSVFFRAINKYVSIMYWIRSFGSFWVGQLITRIRWPPVWHALFTTIAHKSNITPHQVAACDPLSHATCDPLR